MAVRTPSGTPNPAKLLQINNEKTLGSAIIYKKLLHFHQLLL